MPTRLFMFMLTSHYNKNMDISTSLRVDEKKLSFEWYFLREKGEQTFVRSPKKYYKLILHILEFM